MRFTAPLHVTPTLFTPDVKHSTLRADSTAAKIITSSHNCSVLKATLKAWTTLPHYFTAPLEFAAMVQKQRLMNQAFVFSWSEARPQWRPCDLVVSTKGGNCCVPPLAATRCRRSRRRKRSRRRAAEQVPRRPARPAALQRSPRRRRWSDGWKKERRGGREASERKRTAAGRGRK